MNAKLKFIIIHLYNEKGISIPNKLLFLNKVNEKFPYLFNIDPILSHPNTPPNIPIIFLSSHNGFSLTIMKNIIQFRYDDNTNTDIIDSHSYALDSIFYNKAEEIIRYFESVNINFDRLGMTETLQIMMNNVNPAEMIFEKFFRSENINRENTRDIEIRHRITSKIENYYDINNWIFIKTNQEIEKQSFEFTVDLLTEKGLVYDFNANTLIECMGLYKKVIDNNLGKALKIIGE